MGHRRDAEGHGSPPVLVCTVDGVPPGADWLAPEERTRLDGLRAERRRRDWRLGRWAAKAVLATALADGPSEDGAEGDPRGRPAADGRPSPERLAVLAADDGAPEAFLDGTPLPLALSLTHRGGLAVAAVAPGGTLLGCDLELVEPRSERFVDDYLTAAEAARVRSVGSDEDRDLLANLTWSAKESALKALRVGLTRDTRSVVVDLELDDGAGGDGVREPTVGGWRRLSVRDLTGGTTLHGWWRHLAGALVTVVAEPPPGDGHPPRLVPPPRGWTG